MDDHNMKLYRFICRYSLLCICIIFATQVVDCRYPRWTKLPFTLESCFGSCSKLCKVAQGSPLFTSYFLINYGVFQKFVPIVYCILRMAFDASLAKCTLICLKKRS